MFKLKKFLSVILSASVFLNSAPPTKVFADDSGFDVDEYTRRYCTEKNAKGGYVDEVCADLEARKILSSGEQDYLIMKNQGAQANKDYHYFTFRALDKIAEVLDWDRKEAEGCRKLALIERKMNFIFNKITTAIMAAAGGIVGFVVGDYGFKLVESQKKNDEVVLEVPSAQKKYSNKESKTKWSKFKNWLQRELKDTEKWSSRFLMSFLGSSVFLLVFAAMHALSCGSWLLINSGMKNVSKLNNQKCREADFLIENSVDYFEDYNLDKYFKIIIDYDANAKPEVRFRPYYVDKGLFYNKKEIASFKEKAKELVEALKNNNQKRHDMYRECEVLKYGEEEVARKEKLLDEFFKERSNKRKEN